MEFTTKIMDVALSLLQDEELLIHWMSIIMIMTGVLVVVLLHFIPAPYGRYANTAWGPPINSKVAWVVQELPAFLVATALMLIGYKSMSICNVILLSMFIIHYFQRSCIYPLLIVGGKPTPFIPFFLALTFCAYNGLLQGIYLMRQAKYPNDWMTSPGFLIGFSLFVLGMAVNVHSDHVLRNLRKPGETGYKIPKGGMFDYVSCANYFGETLEWGGYALACWSLPGLAFFIFTVTNLGPRAVDHHRWYLNKFEDYPKSRKAYIPFLI